MAFDPDAWLAANDAPAKGKKKPVDGFDPDAWLASNDTPAITTERQRMEQKQHAAVPTEGGAPSPDYKERADSAVSRAIIDPNARRELLRGVDNSVTFGVGQRIARAAEDNPVGRAVSRAMGGPEDGMSPKQQALDAEAAPGYRTAGEVAGAFAPGASNIVSKNAIGGVKEFVSRFAPKVDKLKGIVPGGLAGAAKGAAAYELSSPVIAGAQEAISPDDQRSALRAMYDAATNPMGLGTAIGVGAGGGSSEGFKRKILDPKTISGRTAAAVEAGGGKIKMFGEPVTDEGLYATREMQALPHGKEGSNMAVDQGARKLAKYHGLKKAKASADYNGVMDSVTAEHADRHHFMVGLTDDLNKLEADNQVNGEVGDVALHRTIEKVRRMLTKKTDVIDREATGIAMENNPQAGAEYVSAYPVAKVEDIRKVQRIVHDQAQFGSPATPDNIPYRTIHGLLAREAEAIDPRIAQANQKYAAEMRQLERANDLVFRSDSPNTPTRASKQKQARAFLARTGDTTQAATLDAPDYKELRGMSPTYDKILQQIEAKKAQERLRYGEVEESENIGKHRDGHGLLSLFGITPRNKEIAKLRLGVPLASMGERMNPASAGQAANAATDPITNALMEQKRKGRELSHKLAPSLVDPTETQAFQARFAQQMAELKRKQEQEDFLRALAEQQQGVPQ